MAMPHHSPQDPEPDTSHPEHAALPVTPIQTSGPLRRTLPWALSAAAVLGLMLVMLFLVLPRLSQIPRPARTPLLPSDSAAAVLPPSGPGQPPPALPAAQTAADGQVPLTVTLYSAGSGKHVPVGNPVLISAFAGLPPGESATIAISCTRNGGSRSLLTLAQGSLSTAYWTPAVPGRYDFGASALDSRKISAFSRHIIIVADAPPAPVRPVLSPVMPPAPPPVKAAASAAGVKKQTPHRAAARPLPVQHPAPKHSTPQASRLKPYHVAAATFVVRPIAETLAGALRRRGFHAFVRVVTQPHHKPMYAVETGDYPHPADAQKQVETLKRDGYPASISR